MAITRSRASNSTTQQVAQDTWADILPLLAGAAAFQGCEELVVQCTAASAAAIKISVASKAGTASGSVGADTSKPGIGDTSHRIGVAVADTPDDWIELAAGESMTFAGSLDNKITRVMVAGSGGAANCKWSITKP